MILEGLILVLQGAGIALVFVGAWSLVDWWLRRRKRDASDAALAEEIGRQFAFRGFPR